MAFLSYPFKLEVACENSSLAGVHTLAAVEELWHEGRVEGIEVDRGHVVNGEGDFLLKKVVTLVEKDLQQHVDEVEEHRGPEKLLRNNKKNKAVTNGVYTWVMSTRCRGHMSSLHVSPFTAALITGDTFVFSFLCLYVIPETSYPPYS